MQARDLNQIIKDKDERIDTLYRANEELRLKIYRVGVSLGYIAADESLSSTSSDCLKENEELKAQIEYLKKLV